MEGLPTDKKIILFDGVCNLCDSLVRYIISRDKNDVFRFVSIQSELGNRIMKHIGLDSKTLDTIVLYEPRLAYYTKSNAVMEIAKHLGGPASLLSAFWFIPKFLRDPIYEFVAKNRYKWYGKKTECMVPSERLKKKFL